jgi:hypothetical protein
LHLRNRLGPRPEHFPVKEEPRYDSMRTLGPAMVS